MSDSISNVQLTEGKKFDVEIRVDYSPRASHTLIAIVDKRNNKLLRPALRIEVQDPEVLELLNEALNKYKTKQEKRK